MIAKEFPS